MPLLEAGQTPFKWLSTQNKLPNPTLESQLQTVGQSLLLSRALLRDKEPKRRRSGLLLASETANFLIARLPGEKWLVARVYQGFILPNIALANVEMWRDPSRGRLLEAAVAAFGGAGEVAAQKRVLEWLLVTLEKQSGASSNTLDWTRGTLASLLAAPENAPHADLKRAQTLLQSVTSPNMRGFALLKDAVEERLQNTKVAPSTSTQP